MEDRGLEGFVALCGSDAGEARAGDAAWVSGGFRVYSGASDSGGDLVKQCLSCGLWNVLGDECCWYVDGPSSLYAGE